MLSIFDRPEDSKNLYFKLNQSLLLTINEHNGNFKYAGVYAIFKENICYYVGQTQNLSSRLSTHLTGKYINADKVLIFTAYENTCDDFYTLHKDDQKHHLLLNESVAIKLFKPIENIIVNYESDGEWNYMFDIFEAYNTDQLLIQYAPLQIDVTESHITVHTGEIYEELYNIDINLLRDYMEEDRQILEYIATRAKK